MQVLRFTGPAHTIHPITCFLIVSFVPKGRKAEMQAAADALGECLMEMHYQGHGWAHGWSGGQTEAHTGSLGLRLNAPHQLADREGHALPLPKWRA